MRLRRLHKLRALFAAALACASAAPVTASAQTERAEREEVRIARETAAMAACLVDSDYHLDAFLSTIPGTRDSSMPMTGSADEVAAFAALAPVIGTCLPAGETIRVNVRTLRPFFAEAAYRAAALDELGR